MHVLFYPGFRIWIKNAALLLLQQTILLLMHIALTQQTLNAFEDLLQRELKRWIINLWYIPYSTEKLTENEYEFLLCLFINLSSINRFFSFPSIKCRKEGSNKQHCTSTAQWKKRVYIYNILPEIIKSQQLGDFFE